MKRAEALRPLSREHLVALIAAKKMRESAELDSSVSTFLEFWHSDGMAHFRVEEEVLLPTWAVHAEVDHDGVNRMLEEHLAIRREALRLEAGEAALDEVQALGRLLHDHVRFEERQLFPKVEEALDASALSRLAAAIEAAEGSAPPS